MDGDRKDMFFREQKFAPIVRMGKSVRLGLKIAFLSGHGPRIVTLDVAKTKFPL